MPRAQRQPSETEPLLHAAGHGETFDNARPQKPQLGVMSAGFLIFNRVIGTGIYATPSNILRSAGSVGVALIMWLAGSLIAATGTTVYVELGTGLPKSGGEKNYLEYIYQRPKFLTTCSFAFYALITGSATANSVVFSEYLLHAVDLSPTWLRTRLFAFACLTFLCLIHGTALKWGLRIQNALGLLKLVVLTLVAGSGILSLMGVPGFQVRDEYEKPDNFKWEKIWEGSGTGINAFVAGMYAVIWSFIGYANANSALSEIKDPVQTIKRAAPVAMFSVSIVYLLINVAYFAVVSKSDILGSRRIIAALFFRNLFGPKTERFLSAFIAMSTLGNLLAGQFAQGRIIQELAREGILPFSSFFSSNKPFNAPLSGLALQYMISSIFLFGIPPGDAYIFLISLSSYCSTLVNILVAFGLLLMHFSTSDRSKLWNPPFRAPNIIVIMFFVSNVFLGVMPFIPPKSGSRPYEHLPYWSHSVVAFAVSTIGIMYWYMWGTWLPRHRGYELRRELVVQDGVRRFAFQKVPVSAYS